MPVQTYSSRPQTVQAIQWDHYNFEEIEAFVATSEFYTVTNNDGMLTLSTAETTMQAPQGHWIIKRDTGDFVMYDPYYFMKAFITE